MRLNLRDKRTNLRDNKKTLGRCCLRRMGCGRIFGHMRFEALGSRSSWLWMRTHRGRVFICPAAGGGYRHLYSSSLSSWNEKWMYFKLLKTVQFR